MLADWDASSISWIGSIQSFLVMFTGAATGPLYDAGYFRAQVVTGSFLIVFGYMMLSLCDEYWQVMLAQGICVSLGSGAIFVPGVAILSTYFTRKVSLAVGIAASGSSVGGVVYPLIFRVLQPRIGFGWACRVTGFIALAGLLIANAVMRVRALPASRRSFLDRSAFKEAPYTLFSVGIFLAFMGLYTPLYYVQDFAVRRNIGDSGLRLNLLAILNAASTFGRIIPNFLADKLGPFNIMVPCAAMSGILSFTLIAVDSTASMVVFCVVYGFFSGTFVSLMPTILVSLSPKPKVLGTRMGMCFTFVAIGLLIGAPIAGAILDRDHFDQAWIYGGAFTIAGAASIMAARSFSSGWKFWVRV
ncbi:Aspyridones efflux protein apdF [Lasiodiplodia hormozganensis]|uniref:Aspyridones efflux protein apdF n=1 Tax=Lasiodiplodia hormozganensis TaxID=869390 RepID=A0AA40CVU7_9PEZI|nr:Aspyridones efflux protein apdF [Lasiodiplodia hormozganensis]